MNKMNTNLYTLSIFIIIHPTTITSNCIMNKLVKTCKQSQYRLYSFTIFINKVHYFMSYVSACLRPCLNGLHCIITEDY